MSHFYLHGFTLIRHELVISSHTSLGLWLASHAGSKGAPDDNFDNENNRDIAMNA